MKKISLIFIALLFLVGCTQNKSPETPNDTPPPSEKEPDDNNGSDKDDDNEVTALNEMWDLYTDSYEGIEVTEIELKHKGSKLVYEFEGYLDGKEYEVTYDAYSKEVLDEDIDDSSRPSHTLKKDDLKNVDELIKESEKELADGYKLDAWELEAESDMVELEIEFENDQGDEIEFKYNANTKELIKKSD